MTVLPRDTWPSPAITTLPWRRTETMVVKGESPRCGANLPGWKLRWGARRGFSTGGG
jgi:hypothetical protein